MAEKASATIDRFVRVSKERMAAVQKESTSRLIDIIQTPVAKGGRMRVDTGFLRASGMASLNGMPTGPTRGEPDQTYDVQPVEAVLAQAKPGQTIFFGWTANYATIREFFDGFLRLGVQRWQQIVNEVVQELKQRIK